MKVTQVEAASRSAKERDSKKRAIKEKENAAKLAHEVDRAARAAAWEDALCIVHGPPKKRTVCLLCKPTSSWKKL